MAQPPKPPPRPDRPKGGNRDSYLNQAEPPRHVDHEEIAKLLDQRDQLIDNVPNRRYSEYTNVPPVYRVISQSGSEDVPTSNIRREFSDIHLDRGRRSASQHGSTSHPHGNGTEDQDVPHKRKTVYDTPRKQSTRFGPIREIPSTEGATTSDNPVIYTAVVKPDGEGGVKPGKQENKEVGDKKSDDIEMEDMTQDKSGDSTVVNPPPTAARPAPAPPVKPPSKAFKPVFSTRRRTRSSHRRKTNHNSGTENASDVNKGRSLPETSNNDDDVKNLNENDVNGIMSHRYDDLPGLKRFSKTLHILRSPPKPPPKPSDAEESAKYQRNTARKHQLFVQLNELDRDEDDNERSEFLSAGACWKPRGRWIKFEENWEEGADRWSKPHVASLTFNSLPQLRKALENGVVILDLDETALPNIFHAIVDNLVSRKMIEPDSQYTLLQMLFRNITAVRRRHRSSVRQSMRESMAHLRHLSVSSSKGRSRTASMSSHLIDHKESQNERTEEGNSSNNARISDGEVYDVVYIPMDEMRETSISHNNNNATGYATIGEPREGIARKLDEDAEGALVMTALEDTLKRPVTVLIRLSNPQIYENLLEAQIPLRFIFFLVGPEYSNVNYHQVGRAMSTLFSDDVFRDRVYSAEDKQDILNGINEFLNDTMVLPPGDWDKELLLPITRHQKREQQMLKLRRKGTMHIKKHSDEKKHKMAKIDLLECADPLRRTCRIFGGLINDIKRRYRHYKSDITDGLNFHCIAAFVFVYFACLSPAIAFGGLLGEKTDNYMGVTEMIVSTSLCGMLFALFSGQPLIILGGTGPVLIFEEYLYKFCKDSDVDFMAFRAFIGFWICIIAIVVVALEGSVLVRYFTRFTEEIFSTLISLIFIYKTYVGLKYIICANPIIDDYCLDSTLLNDTTTGIEIHHMDPVRGPPGPAHYSLPTLASHTPDEIPSDGAHHDEDSHCNEVHEGKHEGCTPSHDPHPNTALFAIILTLSTFLISFFLRYFRTSQFLGRTVRRALGNFGIAIAILLMVTFAYLGRDILYYDTIKISDHFHPTDPCKRGWLIHPLGQKSSLPMWAMFGAVVPAFLVFILLYMETLLIGMVVNKEENKLRKGSGYHLDLFLVGVLAAIAGVMGVPWMCAAPIRTVSHVGSLTVLTSHLAPGVKPKLDHIKDQRITNFAISLLIGLSNFMAPILKEIPVAVLLGVFLYLGVTSLYGLQFMERIQLLFMPRKHHPDISYTRRVTAKKMHLFTVIQIICVLVLWAIENSIIAITFPFFLILLIVVRKLIKYIFTKAELEALDCEEEHEEDDRNAFDCDIG